MTEISDATSTTDLPFHPVSIARAHEEVVDQIILCIRAGLVRPGEQLPTIEALSEVTGVSKPVIGEAVRVLRERGVLQTKRGIQGGITVVSDAIPPDLMRFSSGWREATLTELVEARRPIETELALLAGERGSEADFEAMRETLALLDAALESDSEGTFLRYDHLFHYQIGLAARSEMLGFFQHRILSSIAAVLYEYELFHEDPDLVVDTHRAMLAAIEDRDPDAIRSSVDHHWRTSSGAFASIEELSNPGRAEH